MLLTALAEYARSSAEVVPPGYADKPLGFRLVLDRDLAGCRLDWCYQPESRNGKDVLVAPSEVVPNIKRSGTKPPPMLACDNAGYVLGRPKVVADPAAQEKEDQKAAAKREQFDELLAEYAAASGDEAASAFLRWRDAGEPGLAAEIAALSDAQLKRLDVDLIAIAIEGHGEPLHASVAAKAFWAERAMGSKSSGASGICLSCGEFRPLVETIPQSLRGALIPGATQADVAMLSANFPAASRGASGIGLKSAPVCVECASGAVAAFNTLANSDDNRWGARSDERATIWWTKRNEIDFLAIERPEDRHVQDFLAALDKNAGSTGSDLESMDRFYALTFSGNVARLVVRQWIDLPLVQAHANVSAWFEDIKGPDSRHRYESLSNLARSAGPVSRRDGKWHEVAPEGSRELLLRCAIVGAPLPLGLLVGAVGRARAEIRYLNDDDVSTARTARRRMRARFSLIRLMLNRHGYKEDKLSHDLDETRKDPPYLSGRLFAVRESLQYRASGGVNASITDRFFSRASLDPRSVEGTLVRLQQQHLKMLERKGDDAAAGAIKGRLRALQAVQSDAPGRLSASEQAMWVAGYYQQQQSDLQSAREHRDQAAIQAADQEREDQE